MGEKNKSGSFADKMLNLDKAWIYLGIIVTITAPLIRPFYLPITVSYYTEAYYNAIENLKPGDIVLTQFDLEAGTVGELGSLIIMTVDHLCSKPGVRWVQICFTRSDSAVIFDSLFVPKINFGDKVYGKDYVILPFVQGGQIAQASFARDVKGFLKEDYYGNKINTLPLMQQLNTVADFNLGIFITQSEGHFEQFTIPYKLPSIAARLSMGWGEALAKFSAGIIIGAVNGYRGTAEYSILLKHPSPAITAMDAVSMSHVFLLALCFITNGIYVYRRFIKKKVGVGA